MKQARPESRAGGDADSGTDSGGSQEQPGPRVRNEDMRCNTCHTHSGFIATTATATKLLLYF